MMRVRDVTSGRFIQRSFSCSRASRTVERVAEDDRSAPVAAGIRALRGWRPPTDGGLGERRGGGRPG
eukprot:3559676-Pleurochrysis_carterae.AAC.1